MLVLFLGVAKHNMLPELVFREAVDKSCLTDRLTKTRRCLTAMHMSEIYHVYRSGSLSRCTNAVLTGTHLC